MADSSKYTSKLKGQRVLIFGGSSGLGFAVAEASIEHGATVVISSSSQQKVDAAIERINKSYPSAKDRVSGFACDLGDATTLEQNVKDALEKAGKLDHIIHTAGEPLKVIPLQDITVDIAFKSAMVRYYAPMMIGKHATKHLNPGPKSSLILSTGGIIDRPIANWVLPAGTMCAVDGLMRALALDLAPIRVNHVSPGAVDTELWDHLPREIYENFKRQTSENPTGRIGQPEDVAEAYIYLMKDSNITGTSIKSNSGAFLK